MKIESVKFKNINSLQGEWEIRFDLPPLSDTGLFAIVGPNGSGKTSILDALTLALYGETPRMKDPERGVMNRESDESFSEVTFSVAGSLYRSRWSARERERGIPEAPEMVLSGLNGRETILEDKIIKVRSRIEELTGLDFKRFCRTVLLAQGEFTAFLNALESERSEVLQKVIGPELIREIEELIHARAGEENEKLLKLKEALEDFSLLDRDRVKALRETLEQAEEGLSETEGLLRELGIQEEWLKGLELLESEHLSASESLASAEAEAARAKGDFDRLGEAGKAVPFREEMARLEELLSTAGKAQAELTGLEGEIESGRERVDQLEEQLFDNRPRLEQARERLKDRGDEIQKARQLEQEISEEGNRFLELVGQYEALERAQKEKLQEQPDLERQIAELRDQSAGLLDWLDAHGADARLGTGLPLMDEIVSRLKETRPRIVELETREAETRKTEELAARTLKRAERSMLKIDRKVEKLIARKNERERRLDTLLEAETLDSLRTRRAQWKKRLGALKKLIKVGKKARKITRGEDLEAVLATVKLRRDDLTQSLSREQGVLSELEKRAWWRETVLELTRHRTMIEPGKPCPLCGAMEHPFAEAGVPDLGAPDNALVQQRERINSVQNELKALDVKASEMQPRLKALQPLLKKWTTLCEQAGGQWPMTGTDAVREDYRSLKTKTGRLKSRISAYRWLKWRTAWTDHSLQRGSAKLSAKEDEAGRLRAAHEAQVKTLTDIEARLRELRQDEKIATEELTVRLNEVGEAMPEAGLETGLLQRLAHRWALYRRQKQERDGIEDQLRAVQAQLEGLPGALARLEEQARAVGARIEANQQGLTALKAERDSLFGATDPAREGRDLEDEIALAADTEKSLSTEMESIRELIAAREQALPAAAEHARETGAAAEQAEQEILARAVPAGFALVDEIRDLLAVLDREAAISEQWADAEKALAKAADRFEAVRAALESAREERLTKEALETVQNRVSDAARRRERLQDEVEDARRLLREQRETEQQYREVEQAVAEQEKVLARVMAEEKVLRSQDPARVGSRLQRLMLERLLDRANEHLEVLYGRYALRPVSEEGLVFHVEDSAQGGLLRSIKTLSGGESFLVSLSLALGLAEMAARDRRIESLFLDEGFGALDEEMLYKVMVALKALRANGKTVGIISHVKRLADEIPTQIRVEKQPGGRSRISIVA